MEAMLCDVHARHDEGCLMLFLWRCQRLIEVSRGKSSLKVERTLQSLLLLRESEIEDATVLILEI